MQVEMWLFFILLLINEILKRELKYNCTKKLLTNNKSKTNKGNSKIKL